MGITQERVAQASVPSWTDQRGELSRRIASPLEMVRRRSRQIAELRETVREKSEPRPELSRQLPELRVAVERLTHEFVTLRTAVEQRFKRVESRLDRVENRLDQLAGIALEWCEKRCLSSWPGFGLEKITVPPSGDWVEELWRLVGGAVFDAVLEADLFLRARVRQDLSLEFWLLVEVSGVVDRRDGERAVTRAIVLQPALE